MATRKKAATAQEPTITAPVVFPKERVLTFRRYADRRDLLSVLLEDGKEYTFHLRKDVAFTDGTPFNAEAVKANMDAIVSNLPRHAWLDMVNEIDRNEAVDEYTYKLVLKHPYYPTLVELGLTRPFRFISPKCFIDGETKNGVSGYVGTGPWVLTEHKDKQYAVFTRNERYWGPKPALESVRWKVMPDHQTILLALQKGEIDLIFGSDGDMLNLDAFAGLQKEGTYKTEISAPVASRAILLNAHQPITRDINVRKAFQHAIDKKAIADRVAHPLYKKIVKRTYKLKAHDENNQCGVGDRVRVMETRPLSKDKRWRVVEIIEKAK